VNSDRKNIHIGLYAIIFGLLYWPIETLIHVFIFRQGGFMELFFTPEPNEAWMRLLVSASFIAFGIYAHRTIIHEKALNKILRQQQTRMRKVIDSAHDAYISIDSDSIINDWNPMAEKMFGWSRNDVIGKSLLDTIVPERFHQAHHQGMQTYLENSSGPWLYRTITTMARHSNGKEFEVEMAIIPLRSGEQQEFYAFIRHAKPEEIDSSTW